MENLHEHFHSQPPKAPEHAHPQLAGPLFYEGLRWLVWTWPGSLQGLRRPVVARPVRVANEPPLTWC